MIKGKPYRWQIGKATFGQYMEICTIDEARISGKSWVGMYAKNIHRMCLPPYTSSYVRDRHIFSGGYIDERFMYNSGNIAYKPRT